MSKNTFDNPEKWFNKTANKTKKSSGAGGGKTRVKPRSNTIAKAKTANVAKGVKASTPQVMVKVTGASKGANKAQAHLDYIGRKGEVEIENEQGDKFKGKDQKELMKAWQAMGMHDDHKTGQRKEAFHIVFSMPEGTNADALKSAVRNTVEEEFAGHKYFIAQHLDTNNPHCHVLVCATDDRGARLNPRKDDLHNYRVAFVEKLAEQGIEATASRRVHRMKIEQGKSQGVYHRDKRENRPNKIMTVTTESLTKIKGTFDSIKNDYKHYQKSLEDKDIQLKLDINKMIRDKEKENKRILLLNGNKERDINR